MEAIVETKAETILQFIRGLRDSLFVSVEEGTWAVLLHGSAPASRRASAESCARCDLSERRFRPTSGLPIRELPSGDCELKFRVAKTAQTASYISVDTLEEETWPNTQFKASVVRLRVERTPRDGGLEISSS
jgi:hypothetical protein